MGLMDEVNFPTLIDTQVKEVTGMTWREWCEHLNKWSAETKTLTAITSYLIEQHDMSRLWAQMIAVYYKWECALGNY